MKTLTFTTLAWPTHYNPSRICSAVFRLLAATTLNPIDESCNSIFKYMAKVALPPQQSSLQLQRR